MTEQLNKFWGDLVADVKATIDGEPDFIANTANIAALLYHGLNSIKDNKINWAGFYFEKNGQLVLGPFQGKVACVRINFGRGVCGTTASNKTSTIVPDVHQFPGHIACDSETNSEIVVPILTGDHVWGVLDIDCLTLNAFDDEDRKGLEACAAIVADLMANPPSATDLSKVKSH